MSDTIVVIGRPTSPSAPDGVSVTGGNAGGGLNFPIPFHIVGHDDFMVLAINNDVFDATRRNQSTIDPLTGELPYDDTVAIERGDKRLLLTYKNFSDALNELNRLGDVWKQGAMILVLSDTTFITFGDVNQMTSFLSNSNRIAKTEFIREKEGFHAAGYVPRDAAGNALGQSGVTIGVGIDLGGRSAQSMLNDGVPQNLVDILSPYLGLKGQSAVDKLNQSPLSLPESQAMDISNIYVNQYSAGIASRYSSAAGSSFSALPLNTRTAIVSVAYQYGQNLAQAAPTFWNYVTQKQWANVVNELNNFGDAYPTRRQSEAALIQADINSGKLK